MLVLGIETTCDETACAVVRDGREILSNVIASQIDLHAPYGGVVPELACRSHIDLLPSVLKESLAQADLSIQDLDLISVAHGPGLIGALLIGLNMAKGLSLGANKPLIGVNHIEAHLYAPFMQTEIPLPTLGLVISGGHTALVVIEKIGCHRLIGQTQDDAIGEAFDKVAKLLGLPYPGGPEIEKLALEGDPLRYPFKMGKLKNRPYDFSFSGLKTAVLYLVKGQNCSKGSPLIISEADKKDVAASFQRAAFSDIVSKSLLVAKEHQCKSIVIGGGVSNNRNLRERFAEQDSFPVFWPEKGLSLDNGAMIAGLGYHHYLLRGSDSLDLQALPRIPL
ncbi:MAG: tRNA N6-adenosine threonylcarbamoyltransferase [Chlamydiae bacterium]|nr:tRNA N6-adenosine threonylcarbamoyltransferase [Chlamydiota bacterium]